MQHMMMSTPPSKPLFEPKLNPIACRRVAEWSQSPWGDRFLNYTYDTKVIEGQKQIAKKLKKEVKMELLCIGDKPVMEQLHFIDSIERLGVAYHFETGIQEALQGIHKMSTDANSSDLVLTSLRFRLLRQHGFKVSSDMFKGFIASGGSFDEKIAIDVQGLLSLYEACHVRVHGEDILDEALLFTTSNLITFLSDSNPTPLQECITHALKMPLHKRLVRLESVRYMQVYNEDDPLHNETLLKFAKLDFNLLQAIHKNELSEICRQWKLRNVASKLPLRDRIVEVYFWAMGAYYEPQHAIARKITSFGAHLMASIDDIYDAYGTLEELEIFTEAIHRWDKSCLDTLPNDLRWFYKTFILEAHEEIERDLTPVGRSKYMHYAKQEVQALSRSYMTEARWRHNKYIPTLDEYMANDLYRNTAYVAVILYTFLGMDMAADFEFEWLCNLAKPVKAVCHILRILNDIGGNKFDEKRGLSSMYIECYMREYGVATYEEACKELYKKCDELWKDIKEGMIQPREIPAELYNKCVLNMARVAEIIYDGGEDGFTLVNQAMKDNIETLYGDPIPM